MGWKTFSRYRYFSDPAMIFFPSGIIIHKKDRELFGKEGPLLSLKELLKNTHLKLGVIDAFDYLIGWPSQPVVTEKLNQIPSDFIFYNI